MITVAMGNGLTILFNPETQELIGQENGKVIPPELLLKAVATGKLAWATPQMEESIKQLAGMSMGVAAQVPAISAVPVVPQAQQKNYFHKLEETKVEDIDMFVVDIPPSLAKLFTQKRGCKYMPEKHLSVAGFFFPVWWGVVWGQWKYALVTTLLLPMCITVTMTTNGTTETWTLFPFSNVIGGISLLILNIYILLNGYKIAAVGMGDKASEQAYQDRKKWVWILGLFATPPIFGVIAGIAFIAGIMKYIVPS